MSTIPKESISAIANQLYGKAKRQLLTFKIMASILVFVITFSIYFSLEAAFYFSSITKIIFSGIAFLSFVLTYIVLSLQKESFFRSLFYPKETLKLNPFEAFYRDLADNAELPELKYYLDLQRDNQNQGIFVQTALVQLEEKLEQKNGLNRMIAVMQNNPILKKMSQFYVVILSVFMVNCIPFFFTDSAVERALVFWETYHRPNPFSFEVNPKTLLVEQGHFQSFSISFSGEKPESVHFEFKTDIEKAYRSYTLIKDSSSYSTELIQLTETGTFRFKMDEFYSDEFEFEVQRLPRFDSLLVTVTPPKYTKEPGFERKYPQSNLEFPEGSVIRIQGWVNKPLQQIEIHSQQMDSLQLKNDENQSQLWTTEFVSKKTDTLEFKLNDQYGLENSNPYPIYITPVKDKYPSVILLRPNPLTTVTTESEVELVFESSDDYGISSTQLEWGIKRLFSDQLEKGSIRLPEPRKSGLRSYVWDFSGFNLQPQEEVRYKVVVWDNDAINKPKRAESAEYVLSIPSLTEQFLGEQQQEEEIGETLTDMKQTMDKASQEYKEFLEKMAENPRQTIENQRKLDEVKQQQDELKKAAEELSEKFEELRKELDSNNQLSDETKKAYEELQKLAEEIKDDSFMKALEELQRSLNNFDQRSIQQAMQQVKFDEQKYKERIARTMELFKQIKLSADTERLQKALENLAQQQDQLAKDSTSSNTEKAQKQEQLQKETQKAEQLAEELSKNPPEKLMNEVNSFIQEMKEELLDAEENMQEATEQLQQENQEQAKPKQKKAKESLQKAAQKAASFKQQMNQQQKSIDKEALELVLNQLLVLSETEERILLKTNNLDQKSNGFVQQARGQQLINQVFQVVSDTLYRVASVNASLSGSVLDKKNETLRDLERSLSFLTERDRISSVTQIRTAMGGINELASLLVTILEQADNNSDGEGGGGGMSPEQMMQQMKDMSGQQQQLNQQLQEMINDMQGNRLSQEGMERMEQISKMQQNILKQLEEMKKNGSFQQGDKTLSELKRIAEEMEDAINDLRGGRTDRITIKRQQNILSRMLQAEKAMEEREEDEKRKGKNPEENLYINPPPVSLEELKKRIMMQLQNGELTPYSKDYQELIELYFKELEKRIN